MIEKRVLFCLFSSGLMLIPQVSVCIECHALSAERIVVKQDAVICGNKKIGKNLTVGNLQLGSCPARTALRSPERGLVHLGGRVCLRGELNLPQTIQNVSVSQFFDIPLYIQNLEASVAQGCEVETCGVTILPNAQASRGFNNQTISDSDYSFAVVEIMISVSFEPGFCSWPSIFVSFEEKGMNGDLFEGCLVKSVPAAGPEFCIMWTNAQFIPRVHTNSACVHCLLYFSISGLNQDDPDNPFLPSAVAQALNEFVRDIINKTAIDIQAVGPAT